MAISTAGTAEETADEHLPRSTWQMNVYHVPRGGFVLAVMPSLSRIKYTPGLPASGGLIRQLADLGFEVWRFAHRCPQ